MRVKRRTFFVVLAGVVALAAVAYLLRPLAWRSHAETDRLRVSWQTTGKPCQVEGWVVDKERRPAVGVHINVVDDSGGQPATTDSDGHFLVHLGEPGIMELSLGDVGTVTWDSMPSFFELDCSKGIAFRIMIK